MEEKLSRKERKHLKAAEDKKIISGIIALIEKGMTSWKKARCDWAHQDYYYTYAEIGNVGALINCFNERGYRLLTIIHHEAHKEIFRTRKNKQLFNALIPMIEMQIRKKEEEEVQKQQPQDDTTQILPLSPEEREETKLLVIRKHHEELEKFIESLKQT